MHIALERSDMWTLTYINGYGDLVEEQFSDLDEVQIHLEAAFAELGQPFGFRCKYQPKEVKK
jgi:hypothetical protein